MTEIDDLPCAECGRPIGGHTMTEYREHSAAALDLENVDRLDQFRSTNGAPICDHVDVVASVLQVEMQTGAIVVLPAIEFRFSSPLAGPVPPIIWTADTPETFAGLRRRIANACDAAPMRAKQRRRELDQGNGS